MSLYKQPTSKFWWCLFYLNGKPVRRSTGETDRSEAKRAERRIRAEAEAKTPIVERRRGVDDLAALAGKDVERAEAEGCTERHSYVLERRWRRILASLGATTDPQDVTSDKLKAYVQERKDEKVRGQTIRRELQDVHRALTMAKDKRMIAALPEPWPAVEDDEKDRAQAGKLHDPAIVKKVLSYLPADVIDACRFVLATGVRAGELGRVRASWLEPYPYEGDVHWIIRLPKDMTKTREERVLGVSDEFANMIAARRDRLGDLIFPRVTYVKALHTACRRAGYAQNITLRDLRHTFASDKLEETGDLAAVSAALGHSTTMTTELYLHARLHNVVALAASKPKAQAKGKKTIIPKRSYKNVPKNLASQVPAIVEKLERETGFEPATFSLGSSETSENLGSNGARLVEKVSKEVTESRAVDHMSRSYVSVHCNKCGRVLEVEDGPGLFECIMCGSGDVVVEL